jgi:hypothetical protein
LRERATQMRAAGVPFGEICRTLGLPRRTVGDWLYGERARRHLLHPPEPTRCPRCQPTPDVPDNPARYAYLLGLYLGDGHLVTSAKVPVLRVFCADAWPGLIEECETAMLAVLAKNVQRVRRIGCVAVQSYSNHWPCLIPQNGPGRKHERPIYLAEWQQPIVDQNPGSFLRGLFHSDGCRVTNRVKRGNKTYLYPRYMFSNESTDIMSLCQKSLDGLGVEWRMCRRNLLSVARREAVAALDEHVGPKW